MKDMNYYFNNGNLNNLLFLFNKVKYDLQPIEYNPIERTFSLNTTKKVSKTTELEFPVEKYYENDNINFSKQEKGEALVNFNIDTKKITSYEQKNKYGNFGCTDKLAESLGIDLKKTYSLEEFVKTCPDLGIYFDKNLNEITCPKLIKEELIVETIKKIFKSGKVSGKEILENLRTGIAKSINTLISGNEQINDPVVQFLCIGDETWSIQDMMSLYNAISKMRTLSQRNKLSGIAFVRTQNPDYESSDLISKSSAAVEAGRFFNFKEIKDNTGKIIFKGSCIELYDAGSHDNEKDSIINKDIRVALEGINRSTNGQLNLKETNDIESLQRLINIYLNSHDQTTIAVDGVYGTETKDAVKRFKQLMAFDLINDLSNETLSPSEKGKLKTILKSINAPSRSNRCVLKTESDWKNWGKFLSNEESKYIKSLNDKFLKLKKYIDKDQYEIIEKIRKNLSNNELVDRYSDQVKSKIISHLEKLKITDSNANNFILRINEAKSNIEITEAIDNALNYITKITNKEFKQVINGEKINTENLKNSIDLLGTLKFSGKKELIRILEDGISVSNINLSTVINPILGDLAKVELLRVSDEKTQIWSLYNKLQTGKNIDNEFSAFLTQSLNNKYSESRDLAYLIVRKEIFSPSNKLFNVKEQLLLTLQNLKIDYRIESDMIKERKELIKKLTNLSTIDDPKLVDRVFGLLMSWEKKIPESSIVINNFLKQSVTYSSHKNFLLAELLRREGPVDYNSVKNSINIIDKLLEQKDINLDLETIELIYLTPGQDENDTENNILNLILKKPLRNDSQSFKDLLYLIRTIPSYNLSGNSFEVFLNMVHGKLLHSGTDKTERVFVHEIGHNQQLGNPNTMGLLIKEFSKLSFWTTSDGNIPEPIGVNPINSEIPHYGLEEILKVDNIQEDHKGNYYHLKDNFVSDYARFDPLEDYAESYSALTEDPVLLMKKSPEKFLFLNAISAIEGTVPTNFTQNILLKKTMYNSSEIMEIARLAVEDEARKIYNNKPISITLDQFIDEKAVELIKSGLNQICSKNKRIFDLLPNTVGQILEVHKELISSIKYTPNFWDPSEDNSYVHTKNFNNLIEFLEMATTTVPPLYQLNEPVDNVDKKLREEISDIDSMLSKLNELHDKDKQKLFTGQIIYLLSLDPKYKDNQEFKEMKDFFFTNQKLSDKKKNFLIDLLKKEITDSIINAEGSIVDKKGNIINKDKIFVLENYITYLQQLRFTTSKEQEHVLQTIIAGVRSGKIMENEIYDKLNLEMKKVELKNITDKLKTISTVESSEVLDFLKYRSAPSKDIGLLIDKVIKHFSGKLLERKEEAAHQQEILRELIKLKTYILKLNNPYSNIDYLKNKDLTIEDIIRVSKNHKKEILDQVIQKLLLNSVSKDSNSLSKDFVDNIIIELIKAESKDKTIQPLIQELLNGTKMETKVFLETALIAIVKNNISNLEVLMKFFSPDVAKQISQKPNIAIEKIKESISNNIIETFDNLFKVQKEGDFSPKEKLSIMNTLIKIDNYSQILYNAFNKIQNKDSIYNKFRSYIRDNNMKDALSLSSSFKPEDQKDVKAAIKFFVELTQTINKKNDSSDEVFRNLLGTSIPAVFQDLFKGKTSDMYLYETEINNLKKRIQYLAQTPDIKTKIDSQKGKIDDLYFRYIGTPIINLSPIDKLIQLMSKNNMTIQNEVLKVVSNIDNGLLDDFRAISSYQSEFNAEERLKSSRSEEFIESISGKFGLYPTNLLLTIDTVMKRLHTMKLKNALIEDTSPSAVVTNLGKTEDDLLASILGNNNSGIV